MYSEDKMEPVYVVYDRIQTLINGMKDPTTGDLDERARAIKKEVLGDSALEDAHPLYFEMSIIKAWGMTPGKWVQISPYERATILAREYCDNMVQAVDRYYDYIKRQQEKMRSGKR